MIKLKSILREAGLLGEQSNSQLITITNTDTKQTIQDKLNSVDRSKPINLQLGTSIDLNNDAIPTDNDKQNVINQIKLLQSISRTPLVATVNGTTSSPAATPNAPGAILTPETATAFERWVNDNNNTPNNRIQMTSGSSNNNLAIRRAAAMAEAAADAGISSANIRIGNVNTNTERTASIKVTGSFPPVRKKPQFTYDLLVRPATATEVNFYRNNNKPSPGALHFNYSNLRLTDLPGTLVGKSSGIVINEKRFREFINKVASGTNFEMRDTNGKLISNEEYVKRMEDGIIGKFKTLSDVIRPIPDLQIFLLENADAIRAKFPNVDIDRGEYVKGVDNIIKLFKN